VVSRSEMEGRDQVRSPTPRPFSPSDIPSRPSS
jgi:hypothetical protein